MKKLAVSLIATTFAMPAFAQALNCAGRDAAVCQAVNEMVPAVNAEVGSTLLSSSSSRAAFRPANIYTSLLQVRNAAVGAGCAIEGWSGGTYDASAGTESWAGSLADLGQAADDAAGTVTLAPATWSGAAGSRVIGLDAGVHNAAGQVAADIDDDGFKAGNWHRTVGSRGVFLALTGSCPGDAGDALDPWYQGDLASFGAAPATEHLQNFLGTCTPGIQEWGCSDPGGTLGNPNEAVECFTPGLAPPFTVDHVTFMLGNSVGPVVSADIAVYESSGAGPGTKVASYPVAPAQLAAGVQHSMAIPATEITTSHVCVGVTSTPTDDGMRVVANGVGAFGTSFLLAPTCGVGTFTDIRDLAPSGTSTTLCITADIAEL